MSDVVTENPLNRHASWEGLEHDVTPTEEFFCRNHNPFPDPPTELNWAGHRLTLEQLEEMTQVEQVVTLECAGNGRTEFAPVPSGTPWGIRGLSTGRFQGVLLADLLERYPPAEGTRHLIFQGADLGKEGLYERSLTVEEVHQHQAMLALRMNGEALTPKHGAPFRLVVPGYYAMTSIKWLSHVQYSEVPSDGYFQVEDYLVNYDDPSEPIRPATTMQPKSILVRPRQDDRLVGDVAFHGKAWSGVGPVSGVELVITGRDGEQRRQVELGPELGPNAWRSFSFRLSLPPGSYKVASYCQAGSRVQPEAARWNSQGYENNSAHVVEFEVLS